MQVVQTVTTQSEGVKEQITMCKCAAVRYTNTFYKRLLSDFVYLISSDGNLLEIQVCCSRTNKHTNE